MFRLLTLTTILSLGLLAHADNEGRVATVLTSAELASVKREHKGLKGLTLMDIYVHEDRVLLEYGVTGDLEEEVSPICSIEAEVQAVKSIHRKDSAQQSESAYKVRQLQVECLTEINEITVIPSAQPKRKTVGPF